LYFKNICLCLYCILITTAKNCIFYFDWRTIVLFGKTEIMKKLFLIGMLIMTGSFIAQAQVINFTDVAFKEKLLSAGNGNYIATDSTGNSIRIDANFNDEIEESEALKVYGLRIANIPKIDSMDGIEYFYNLVELHFSNIDTFMTFKLKGLNKLQNLTLPNAIIYKFLFQDLPNLGSISGYTRYIENVSMINLNKLNVLYLNNIQYLNQLNNLPNLEYLYLNYLRDTMLSIHDLPKLKVFSSSYGKIKHVIVDNTPNLYSFTVSYNEINITQLINFENLERFDISYNKLTQIDLSSFSNLNFLNLRGNQLNSLDVSNCINLTTMYVNNNNLSTIYMKNGVDNTDNFSLANFSFANNPLTYICADSNELEALQAQLLRDTITGATINSLCNATLDGAYYTLYGNAKYDADNNGCTTSDPIYPNLKINISNPIDSSYAFSDAQGNFAMVLDSGTYILTPQVNENYFTVSPASTTITFPEDTIPQLLCIAPNGIKHDVAITLVPTRPARPGFSDATYKLVLTNKGNQIESGTIEFKYQDDYQDFISTTPTPTATESGIVSFDFSNLQLFESKTYTITLRTNSPADNPAVNAGDVLYIVTNVAIDNDEDASNNTHAIKQTVVGSIDPNDKTCLEGDIVTPDLVGDYVHYLIRFENTGTANAENIVVTDYIDQSKFDISTLQLTSTSHSCKTTISQGNKVQFIFDNIQLPFTEPLKHGYVAFKIKTLSTLTIGDSLKNKADIYFDYNLPVATNIATSRIDNVSTGIKDKYTQSGKMSVFPNPTNGKCVVNFSSSNSGDMHLKVMNVAGSILYEQIIAHNKNSQIPLDLTVPNGIYFISIGNASEQYMQRVVVAK